MPEGLADVSGEALVVYCSMAVVLALAVATITERGLGPVSRWWFDFAQRRRAAAVKARAADYSGLQQQVTHLNGQVRHLLREQDRSRRAERERDRLAYEHVLWDRKARQALADLGIQLDEPPSLWPSNDPLTVLRTRRRASRRSAG